MKRHIGIIIFVLLFISTISIISILVARGYNFSGSQVRENGILNINSNPEDAKIYISGEEKATTPTKIELVAGTYEIRIEKENYRDWKKTIEVEPSIVTDISATLFSKDLNLEQVTFSNIDKLFFSPDGDIALYTASQGISKGLWLMKLEKTLFEISSSNARKITDLGMFSDQCITSKNYSVIFSQDNNKIILKCHLANDTIYYLIDFKNSNAVISNLNDMIGFTPTSIQFSFDTNNLLVQDETLIANYSLNTKLLTILSYSKDKQNTQIVPFGDEFIIFETKAMQTNGKLWRVNQSLTKTPLIPEEKLSLDKTSNVFASASQQNYIALIMGGKSLVIKVSDMISQTFSGADTTILAWAPNGYSALYIENNVLKTFTIKIYPDNTFKVETYPLITNYTNARYNLSWSNNSQNLLVYDLEDKKLFIIDKDGTNKSILYEGELAESDAFKLSKNETFVLLLLKDNLTESSLYSIKLKV